MHDTTARLYQAAAQLRQIHDIAELALALAVSQQTLRNWEQKGLSKKGFQEAKQVFGLSIKWLESGDGDMLERLPEKFSEPSIVPTHNLDLTQFALQRLGLANKHIITQIVNNDNMLNTLSIGDIVLIDTTIQQYIGSGIYAITTPTGNMIYRINTFQNGFLMLIHDNPAYPPEIVRPDELGSLNITGRVVGKYGVVAL